MNLSVLIVLAGCASSSPDAPPLDDPPEREAVMEAAASELAAGRFGFAEEFLSAAGPEASPWLRPLLDSNRPDVRLAAQAMLLSAGEDLGLSSEEEVQVILFDLSRQESHPFAGIRALDRWRRLPGTPGRQGTTRSHGPLDR